MPRKRGLGRTFGKAKFPLHALDDGRQSFLGYFSIRPAKLCPPKLPICIQTRFGCGALDDHADEGFAARRSLDRFRDRQFEFFGCF